MSDRFLVGVLAAVVTGIVVGERLGPSDATAAVVVGALGLALGSALRGRSGAAVALVAVALLAGALMQRSLHGLVRWPLAAAVDARADVTVTGTLAGDPDGTRYATGVVVRITAARVGERRVDAVGRTVLLHADGEAGAAIRLLEAGDVVEVAGWLRPLQGFDSRYRWRHAVARFDAVELLGARRTTSPLLRAANEVRDRVLAGTRTLPPTERGLVSAFLVGDRRGLPDAVVERFRAAGMSHLLVVSGENVAFVLALVAPVLRRLPRRAAFVAGLAVLLVFGAMTRWEPSVLRACVMAGCAMSAVVLGRPASGRRLLALATVVLLLADPFLLHSVGFLLSCGACAGIVLLGPRFVAHCPGPQWARTVLGTTAAAQVGVAPILLPVFGAIPLVSLPANLLAIPLAGPLTTWGLASGLVGGVVPALAGPISEPTRWMARAMLGIADLASRVPVSIGVRDALGVVSLGSLAVLVGRRRMLRRDAGNAPTPRRAAPAGARRLVVPPR